MRRPSRLRHMRVPYLERRIFLRHRSYHGRLYVDGKLSPWVGLFRWRMHTLVPAIAKTMAARPAIALVDHDHGVGTWHDSAGSRRAEICAPPFVVPIPPP